MEKRYQVLIVDDEEDLRDLIGQFFEMDDFIVFKAADINEAKNIVKEEKLDFIVSDIRMPGGSGIDLLDAIVIRNPEIPVLLMTGQAPTTREEILTKGGFDLFLKPGDLLKLVPTVKKHLESL